MKAVCNIILKFSSDLHSNAIIPGLRNEFLETHNVHSSFSKYNTKEEVNVVVEKLQEMI